MMPWAGKVKNLFIVSGGTAPFAPPWLRPWTLPLRRGSGIKSRTSDSEVAVSSTASFS